MLKKVVEYMRSNNLLGIETAIHFNLENFVNDSIDFYVNL